MTDLDSIKIQRSYKFRCYLGSVQRQQLAVEFGHARWVWNQCLAWRSNLYQDVGEKVTAIDFSRELTFLKQLRTYDWLKEASACVLQQKLREAFRNFFAGRAKYPKFKKKLRAQGIRYPRDQQIVANLYRVGEFLKLPKLGELKLKWSRKPLGIPKMVTITKDCTGRYFASFMCEESIQPLPQKPSGIGVDLGLKDIVVTSSGWKSGNPRYLRTYRRQLTKTQRRLSRRVKGSQRWHRQRMRVANAHARVRNTHQDWLHKLSTTLIGQAGFIAMEDLNVKGMMANRRLEYKAKWTGCELVQVDRWAPTSKTCSTCGTVQETMPLSVREWTCQNCQTVHDRDIRIS